MAVSRRTAGPRTAPAAAALEVLTRLLRGEEASEDWLRPGLLEAAGYHRVVIPLDAAIRKAGLGGEQARQIRGNAMVSSLLSWRLAQAAVELSAWLEEAGISHAVLKGPVVAASYPGGEREYSDLDVLVHPAQLEATLAVLDGHEIRPVGRQPRWASVPGFLGIELVIPRLGSLDLHTDVIHHARVRSSYRLGADTLLDRRRTLQLPAGPISALDGADNLLHVALHAAISGGDRLGWYADIASLTRQEDFSWAALVERALSTGVALPVAVVLDRARSIAAAPVPEEMLGELAGPGPRWAAACRWLERRRPVIDYEGRLLEGRVLLQTTRRTGSSSARELTRFLVAKLALDPIRSATGRPRLMPHFEA